jgi:Stress responsive A/B Barrel Domain
MVHQVALYKLRPDLPADTLDGMIRRTRSLLLKITEVLAVRCGKRIEPDDEWAFFVALDFDSRAKLEMYRDDPIYLKFLLEVIEPHTTGSLIQEFEMDPGKNVKYS